MKSNCMSFDIIIQNACVIDPAQNWDQVADVGVKDGKIGVGSRLDPSGCPCPRRAGAVPVTRID